jgi:hypothetical protein
MQTVERMVGVDAAPSGGESGFQKPFFLKSLKEMSARPFYGSEYNRSLGMGEEQKTGATNYERFNNIASGVQAVVVSVGVILGGVWTATTFVALSQAKKATAEAEKASAEAALAKRSVASKVIVNTSISATQLRTDSKVRRVLVEVSLSNTGNEPIRLDIKKNLRYYVARVIEVGSDGIVKFGDMRPLQFDYADKTIEWVLLPPGAELEKMHSVQVVDRPGTYLARFSVSLADSPDGTGREYSSDSYFQVK